MAIRSPRVFGLSSGFEGRLVFAANTPDASCHRYEKNFGLLNMGSANSVSSLADAMRAPLEQAVIAVTHPDRERGCLISTGMIACHPDHATLARDAAMRHDAMRERIADSLAAFAPAPVVRWFARYLAAVMQAMSVQARDGATQAELLEIVADVVIDITARFAIDARAGVRSNAAGYALSGMRAMILISKSKPASQLTPIAVQFG